MNITSDILVLILLKMILLFIANPLYKTDALSYMYHFVLSPTGARRNADGR